VIIKERNDVLVVSISVDGVRFKIRMNDLEGDGSSLLVLRIGPIG
jgi:hypothetical protein